MTHPSEVNLALYSGGETGFWTGLAIRAHVRNCALCQRKLEEFVSVREAARNASDLPAGMDWDRMAAEMTANIHLGLSAGECVAPTPKLSENEPATDWETWQRPAVVFAGTVLAVFLAWFAYTQPAPREEPQQASVQGVTAEATDDGIELVDNGRILGLNRAADEQVVSVSLQGSVRARYVDSETGQVTIHNVYVQ